MAGLRIKLGSYEQIYINGALIQNGERQSSLNVLSAATDLIRVRDLIDESMWQDTPKHQIQ